MTKKIKLVKGYAYKGKYIDYLGEHFFTNESMRMFGTSSIVYDILIDGMLQGIKIKNKKAPAEIQDVFYIFKNEGNEIRSTPVYSIDDLVEYVANK